MGALPSEVRQTFTVHRGWHRRQAIALINFAPLAFGFVGVAMGLGIGKLTTMWVGNVLAFLGLIGGIWLARLILRQVHQPPFTEAR
ncbi:MAG: hypothetical protein QOG53_2198 [Frankiales bacterium]|nr:hypothetical protein [Frankiales bacterium]